MSKRKFEEIALPRAYVEVENNFKDTLKRIENRDTQLVDDLYETVTQELTEPTLQRLKIRKSKNGKTAQFETLVPNLECIVKIVKNLSDEHQKWFLHQLCAEMYVTEEMDRFKTHFPKKFHKNLPEEPSDQTEEESEFSGDETEEDDVGKYTSDTE